MQVNDNPLPREAARSAPAQSAGEAARQDAKLRAACKDMEAVFLNMLLTEMRKTVPKSGLADGGSQEEIIRSLLDGEMAKNMAESGGTGLADMLYRQLSPKQEKTGK